MNPNPNMKLTDCSAKQLSYVGRALNAAMACGLVKDYEKADVNEFFIQILNAINTVESKEKVNQN